jgi:ABC-type Na+ efflux pump permease subunit
MPEGVASYPRWHGVLSTFPAFPVIAAQEIRRALRNPWVQSIFILAFGLTAVSLSQVSSRDALEMSFFTRLTDFLIWLGLATAAVIAGPSLLEDNRRGALELYLSRAVTRLDHLFGKAAAVLAVTLITVSGPLVVFWVLSWMIFETHPAGWDVAVLAALGYGLVWSLVMTALGLGLSCVGRSSRAASLLLFGGFALVEILVVGVLRSLTNNDIVNVFSPFSAMQQQQEWLFKVDALQPFPYWYGLLLLGALFAIGLSLVAWRHPRLKGVE